MNILSSAQLDVDKEYIIRVIGKNQRPYEYFVHWVLDEDQKRRKVKCSTAYDCIACQLGESAQTRFLIPVLLRSASKPVVFDFTRPVNSFLRGDLSQYDIRIKKNKYNRFSVIPQTKSPLSVREQEIADEFLNSIDLKKLSAPGTNEEIADVLGVVP